MGGDCGLSGATAPMTHLEGAVHVGTEMDEREDSPGEGAARFQLGQVVLLSFIDAQEWERVRGEMEGNVSF